MSSSPTATIQNLPTELLELTLLQLPFIDLFRVQSVCRQWNDTLGTSSPLRRVMFKINNSCSPSTHRASATLDSETSIRINPMLIRPSSTPPPFPASLPYASANPLIQQASAYTDSKPDNPPSDAPDNAMSDDDFLQDGADSPSNTPPQPATSIASDRINAKEPISASIAEPVYPDTLHCVLAAGSSLYIITIPSFRARLGEVTSVEPIPPPPPGHTFASLPLEAPPAHLQRLAPDSSASHKPQPEPVQKQIAVPSWINLHVFQDRTVEKASLAMRDLGTPGVLRCVTVENEGGVRVGDLVRGVLGEEGAGVGGLERADEGI
jgi:hypothetical protein